jgi:hypothetical protein
MLAVFFVTYFPALWIADAAGFAGRSSTIAISLLSFPVSVFGSHRICAWLWPKLIQQANRDADRGTTK